MDELCDIIKNDFSKNAANPPTETNWYFYGSTVTKDAIGDSVVRQLWRKRKIRPTVYF
jgi:hypothetical protein